MIKKTRITIGSDPEFIILDGDRAVDANMAMEEYCGGDRFTEIGSDGILGEFRPKYGNTPLEHRDNLKSLIKKIPEILPSKWICRGGTRVDNCSLGGHIHIGNSLIADYSNRCLLISNYLSYFCGILLRKIEHEHDIVYRGLEEDNYGYFGSYEEKSYGIEWRMPASWLVSEEIATSALCLAHVVANEFITTEDLPDIINPIDNEEDRLYYIKFLREDSLNIIKDIEKMKEYPLYKKEIEGLLQMIVNGEEWKDEENILDTW